MKVINMTRVWAMPNSKTFKIKPIKDIILKYVKENDVVIDPFANEHSIQKELKYAKYISNDLDSDFNTNYNLEAQDFMKIFEDSSIDILLYDPPYSNRQVAECYRKLERTVTMSDTNSGYFVKFKKEISRIVKPKGIVISCGWNSGGIGKKYNFEMIEVLLVAHRFNAQ